MSSKLSVVKRDGSSEKFNIDKIHRVIKWAMEGLEGVSLEDVEINAKISLTDGITTSDIHSVLVESAANLISIRNPDYQYVAGRLLNYKLRKQVWGGKTPPTWADFIKRMVKAGLYSEEIFKKYTAREINKLGEAINHDKDLSLTYASIKQLESKYLIGDRSGKGAVVKETPQFMYMGIAMTFFQNYPKETRLDYVKKAYNLYSGQVINIPTPVLIAARTDDYAWASCCLISVDDTKQSINAAMEAVALATADKYGIGVNMGNLRAIGAPVRGGRFKHGGAIPFLKILEANVKAWLQGPRGGSATVTYPIFHYEIEDILPLKSNTGTQDNRVRNLDYSIGLSKLFLQRYLDDKDITLFSFHEVPEIFNNFGLESFGEIYIKAENNPDIKFKKIVKARELFSSLVKERRETGRIYIFFADNANRHSSWNEHVNMANLCQEIIFPMTGLKSLDDEESEIGVCNLGGVNVLSCKTDEELKDACDIVVRGLEEILTLQQYFCKAAENFAKNRRSLGIGITNFAAWLASKKLKYGSSEAIFATDELCEKFQYYLLCSSLELSKEKGACTKFNTSKYSKGILPIDTYSKYIDEYCPRKLSLDWESLRKDILTYGLRHCTLSAELPFESSSITQNATNGTELPTSFVSSKTSKHDSIPFIVPNAKRDAEFYSLAFERKDNDDINKMNGVVQKYFDMAMSTNHYYDYNNYPDGKLPDMVFIKDIFGAFKCGLNTIYYAKFNNNDKDASTDCAGGCKL